MDMWKPFRTSTNRQAPQAAVLFDTFHLLRHLGEALDTVRKAGVRTPDGPRSAVHQGPRVHPAVARENLTTDARKSLTTLLAANTWPNTASLLKETFG